MVDSLEEFPLLYQHSWAAQQWGINSIELLLLTLERFIVSVVTQAV